MLMSLLFDMNNLVISLNFIGCDFNSFEDLIEIYELSFHEWCTTFVIRLTQEFGKNIKPNKFEILCNATFISSTFKKQKILLYTSVIVYTWFSE